VLAAERADRRRRLHAAIELIAYNWFNDRNAQILFKRCDHAQHIPGRSQDVNGIRARVIEKRTLDEGIHGSAGTSWMERNETCMPCSGQPITKRSPTALSRVALAPCSNTAQGTPHNQSNSLSVRPPELAKKGGSKDSGASVGESHTRQAPRAVGQPR
jgi:hypothetical protein